MSGALNLLLSKQQFDEEWNDILADAGEVFRIFDKQDSGCVSYGIRIGERRLFVKYAEREDAVTFLKQARAFNRAFRHPLLPALLNAFSTRTGYALVFEWVEGEVLGTPDYPGEAGRNDPASPHARFRQLPAGRIVDALSAVYECHVELERSGYVAEDFYDGCMIYDFERHKLHLCDFDLYHKGAFLLDRDRCYGSSRFMAPEEWVRGSVIDSRTMVYTMGATAFVFLGNGSRDAADWRASEALFEVALKSVSPERDKRYGSVMEFYDAWCSGVQPYMK